MKIYRNEQSNLAGSIIEVPADKCGIIAETNLKHFPVEPISAATNIIFLIMLAYWAWKTKCKIKLYPFIVITIPLMISALAFNTMFHLLRNNSIWHHLNLLCIVYSVITASVYLWRRVTAKWMYTFFLALCIPVLFQIFIIYMRPVDKLSLNVVFVVMALSVFVPAVIHCIKNKIQFISLLIYSSIFFSIGLFFRLFDSNLIGKTYIGTHFLWHIFCTISIFYFLKYSYNCDKLKTVDKFNEVASSF